MAKYNIQHGDCLELFKRVPDSSIDLVVTDPPYRTITGGKKNGKSSDRPKGILSGNKKIFEFQNIIQISQWVPEVYRVLKDGTHCYIFTNHLNLEEMLCVSRKCGFQLHNVLVWEKNNCTPSQYYMKNCEYVLFLRKGKAKWINNIGDSKTVHQFNNLIGNKTHPTEKPVDLLRFYIENSSEPEQLVFDPFMGSGSTGEAALSSGRYFLGFEIDPDYFDIASSRLSSLQKKEEG